MSGRLAVRSNGVIVALVQFPVKSGFPSGVRGIGFAAGDCAEEVTMATDADTRIRRSRFMLVSPRETICDRRRLWAPCSSSSGSRAEFQDDSDPAVLCPGPMPSECPTCAATSAEADVQSLHVNPAASVPSAFDPVRCRARSERANLSTVR